ncbi:NucA/NucB deoxyribonuclease domain-containing protein [Streptomyces sp. MMS24-I2-30]|uniref:NucA/NucB deoxyribonuclease domain-containing protein n=1 Tax=Streptomyces sp. MMS24-I2-30 TaxID=3351564 RepID=UPI003896E578
MTLAAATAVVTLALPAGAATEASAGSAATQKVSVQLTAPVTAAPLRADNALLAADPNNPKPVSCAARTAKINRTSHCYRNEWPVELQNEATGKIEGRARLHVNIKVRLDPRNRHKWQHSIALKITDPQGPMVLAIVGSADLKCGACTFNRQYPQPLPPNISKTFTMTVSSPHDVTMVDKMQTYVALTAPNAANVDAQPVGPDLHVRCDNTPRISPQEKGGCVYPDVKPTYFISRSHSVYGPVAKHITQAQSRLIQAWGLKGRGPALTITRDDRLNNRNRRAACGNSPRPSCDEYPFASTYEGAFRNKDYSTRTVPLTSNTREGNYRQQWYNRNRLLESDAFWVQPTR